MFINTILFLTLIGIITAPVLGWFFSQNDFLKYFNFGFLMLPAITAAIWIVLVTYGSVSSANATLEGLNLSLTKIISLFTPYVIAMVVVFLIVSFNLKRIPPLVLLVPISLFIIQMLMVQTIGSYLYTFSEEKQDEVALYLDMYYVTKSFVVPFLVNACTFVMFVLYMAGVGLREGKMKKAMALNDV